MKKISKLLLFLGGSVLFAFEPNSTLLAETDKMASIDSIVDDMQKISYLAEKVKMNEPYQPYIVTVFQGPEMERIGVTNLKDALELVPGVDMATDNLDNKRAIFRGSNPSAYGQSRLFIDGVEVNDLFIDGYGMYLDMPIEMIKRIEVTRGPGSVSDGYNAYAGSIRVFTYAQNSFESEEDHDRIVIKGGSYEYRMGGFIKNYQKNDLSLHAQFYYQRDDKYLPAGPDALATGIYGPRNVSLARSGSAPLWMKNSMLQMTLRYKDTTFRAGYLYDKRGSAYGINGALPDPDDSMRMPQKYMEADYHPSMKKWQIHIKAGWKDSQFKSESHLLPAGFSTSSGVVYKDGFYGEHEAKLRRFYQTSYGSYRGWSNHSLSAGYYIDYTKTYKVITKTTDRRDGIGMVDYSRAAPFSDPDAYLRAKRLFVQDRYDYSDKLSLQAGVNIEKVTHMKVQYNPRLSLVYQADGYNIYKAIYSRSSRSPSWQELFTINNHARVGNLALEPERVDAFEAAYIHKMGTDSFLQVNIFYLRNDKQIDNNNAEHEYRNASDSKIYGMEVECKTPIGLDDALYMNYSYVYGKQNGDDPLANAAHHMAKGYYLHRLSGALDMALVGKYVGSKERMRGDPRSKLDSYATLDIAFGYHNGDDLKVRFGMQNLFDADVRYPSVAYNYMNDYPQEGRRVMITLLKGF